MSENDEIVNAIIAREGDFVDHPADRGGPTRWGITQETLTVFRGRPASVDDVKHLSVNEARDIYLKKYIDNAGFGKIEDARLRALAVDSAVNHGIVMAWKLLQRALGVPDDGILGPVTLEALKDEGAVRTGFKMIAKRYSFYGRIVQKDPSQAVFLNGWMNRMEEMMEAFLS